jgi:hypothetical protein
MLSHVGKAECCEQESEEPARTIMEYKKGFMPVKQWYKYNKAVRTRKDSVTIKIVLE